MKKQDLRLVKKEGRVEIRKRAVFAVLNSPRRSISKVAKSFQVRWHTLSGWVKAYEKGGERALGRDKRGAERWANTALTKREANWVRKAIIKKTPEQLEMPFMLWTRQAVKDLIKRKFGKVVALSTITALLKLWNMSSQKPKLKAYAQQPERIKKWIDEEYPLHVQSAKKEKAVIHWCDETTVCSRDLVGKGIALKGQTPVLKAPGSRFSVNMISSVTNRGDVKFMLFEDNMNAVKFIEFMRRLTKGQERKIYLIVDNMRVHHANKVRAWAEKHQDRIKLVYLPPYAPEHNPDEYLNQVLKARLKSRTKDQNAKSLKNSIFTEMKRLQKEQNTITSIFNAPQVKYAA